MPEAANFKLALIFVLFAYSGWYEMACVGAEVREPQRNILRALVLGTLAVTVIYLVLIVPLMPFEEDGLRRAYGGEYEKYARGRRRLVPFVY